MSWQSCYEDKALMASEIGLFNRAEFPWLTTVKLDLCNASPTGYLSEDVLCHCPDSCTRKLGHMATETPP